MASVSFKSVLGIYELKSCEVLCKQLFAEFLGTFLFVSLSLLVSVPGTVTAAFANGLLIASIVQLLGHVSGGHINPAVTVGMMVCGYIKPLRAVCYVVVQAVGAIAVVKPTNPGIMISEIRATDKKMEVNIGAATAYLTTVSKNRGTLGATVPREDLRYDQTLLIELIATFIVVSVALSVSDPNRGSRGLGSASLAIGLSVTACQCACLSYTVSMNPARSLGPAVVMNIWTGHWVYWLAPMLGGMVAGAVYSFVLDTNVTVNL